MVAGGWGESRTWELVLNEYRVSVLQDEKNPGDGRR